MNNYHERNGGHDIIDDLTKTQEKRLNESIRQSDSGCIGVNGGKLRGESYLRRPARIELAPGGYG